jgi:hypothetical protein
MVGTNDLMYTVYKLCKFWFNLSYTENSKTRDVQYYNKWGMTVAMMYVSSVTVYHIVCQNVNVQSESKN